MLELFSSRVLVPPFADPLEKNRVVYLYNESTLLALSLSLFFFPSVERFFIELILLARSQTSHNSLVCVNSNNGVLCSFHCGNISYKLHACIDFEATRTHWDGSREDTNRIPSDRVVRCTIDVACNAFQSVCTFRNAWFYEGCKRRSICTCALPFISVRTPAGFMRNGSVSDH